MGVLMQRYNNYYILPRADAKKAKISVPFSFYGIIVTWFYIGCFRIAPGTLGSIASYPLYYLMIEGSSTRKELVLSLAVLVIVLAILGIWAISRFQRVTKTFDHSCVVIDEVVGMLLTITLSYEWLGDLARWARDNYLDGMHVRDIIFLLALMVFRYFDIRKPFIIRYVDRHVKNAFGVMLDDVLAALFASGVICIANMLLQKFI